MGNDQTASPSLDIRKTKFTMLKDQQCSLNMQIRLAMQLHDTQTQADLEKRLKVTVHRLKK